MTLPRSAPANDDHLESRKGKAEAHWARGVRTGTGGIAFAGATATAVFLVGFGWWAATAPLAGAAIAPGFVAAAGQNQRVQHLEGGIVEEILVKEGDAVQAGQILFRLDRVSTEAQRDRIAKQLVAFSARAERLVAERDGSEILSFTPGLRDLDGTFGLSGMLDEQLKEFVSRLDLFRNEQKILKQRAKALGEQISGLEAQETAVTAQLAVVRDETERKRLLLEKGLTDRSEYTSLLRSEADLVGGVGRVRSEILSSRTQIVEAEEQYARSTTQRVETAATQLNEVRSQIADSEEQLRAAVAILARTDVRSPSDGIVVSMAHNSRGSVVRSGDTMLELLPTTDDLVVEAMVSPQDVDVVSVGQKAKLRFSALNSRTTPEVEAIVSYVSADRIIDPQTRLPHYVARLHMDGKLPPAIEMRDIHPGMPVETFVDTETRTFLDYLLKPLTDNLEMAFRQ